MIDIAAYRSELWSIESAGFNNPLGIVTHHTTAYLIGLPIERAERCRYTFDLPPPERGYGIWAQKYFAFDAFQVTPGDFGITSLPGRNDLRIVARSGEHFTLFHFGNERD